MADDPNDSEAGSNTIRLAQRGDTAALDRLLRRLQPRLERFARHRLSSASRAMVDTADIVQDVMIRTIRRLPELELPNDAALHAYVFKAVRARVIDEARKAAARPANDTLGSVEPAKTRTPDEIIFAVEIRERYESASAKLTAAEQHAVLMRIDLGMSYDEIAMLLGKPSPDAARMFVTRALARLAQEMADVRR